MEWRKVLKTGSLAVAVELTRVGSGPKIPVGLLDFRIEIVPKLERTLPEIEISAQLKAERAHRSEALQLFFVSAKSWWNDYIQISKAHNQRLVKVFAQNECGIDLPVCTYVQSMRPVRLLDSPRHAARFVSLIPFERDESLGGSSKDVWHSIHTFLCKRKGSAEEHAVLLCSLLLGYGLDAYVCMGSDDKGGHAWVLTRDSDGHVVFWESLTGVRYNHNTPTHPSRTYKYQTVECIFNDKCLYANIQADESIARTLFDFSDKALWKPLPLNSAAAIKQQPLPPLLPHTHIELALEGELELLLKNLISEHRKGLGLTTIFDDALAYLLRPALWAYEQERLTQTAQGLGNEEFQQSIKRAVPEGHTFKGFPIQFSHKSPSRMMLAFLRAKACVDILATRADQVRFALQIKVFSYPENVCAVWAMVACKYIDLR
jgi:centrosomal protein CEP76